MIVGIIQARMGSSRLPGKVLKKVGDITIFECFVERIRHAKILDNIVLATTTKSIDDPLVEIADEIKLPVYRGSEQDVLNRFWNCSNIFEASTIVRLLGDCPLLDPHIIEDIVEYYVEHQEEIDFLSNQNPHTYPDGMDVSVFSKNSLDILNKSTQLPSHREHIVTGYWGIPGKFRCQNYYNKINLFKEYRWTLDYPEDLELISCIIKGLYKSGEIFYLDDILNYLKNNQELMKINQKHLPSLS